MPFSLSSLPGTTHRLPADARRRMEHGGDAGVCKPRRSRQPRLHRGQGRHILRRLKSVDSDDEECSVARGGRLVITGSLLKFFVLGGRFQYYSKLNLKERFLNSWFSSFWDLVLWKLSWFPLCLELISWNFLLSLFFFLGFHLHLIDINTISCRVQVVGFVQQLAGLLPEYEIACEHEHSNCLLVAHKKVGTELGALSPSPFLLLLESVDSLLQALAISSALRHPNEFSN